MLAELTPTEKIYAALICGAGLLVGLLMAAAGRADPLTYHGVIVMAYAGVMLWFLLAAREEPMPAADRAVAYYDAPIKLGIVFAMAWALFGMFMGVWVAAQLAWPDLAFDAAWSSFGRLRPTHTTGVIFGFGGNALIAT